MSNVNGVNYAKSINPTLSNRNVPGSVGGRIRSLTETYTFAATPANDTVNIGKKLSAGAIIHDVILDNAALGAGVIIDIGDADTADRYINGYDAQANVTSRGGATAVTGVLQLGGVHYVIGTNTGDDILLATVLIAAATGELKITILYSED